MSLASLPETHAQILTDIDQQVDRLFDRDDAKTLVTLERVRQTYLFWFYAGVLCVLASAAVLFLVRQWHLNVYGHDQVFDHILLFLWFLIIVAGLSPIHIYKSKAKRALMPDLVRIFGDLIWSDTMNGDDGFWSDLRASGLVTAFDRTRVRDFITGTLNKTSVAVAEMELTHGRGRRRTKIFQGVGVSIRLPKPAPLRLLLLPSWQELSPFSFKEDMAAVDVPRLAEAFKIYSSDEALARALLTPAVMEQISELHMLFGRQGMGISLYGGSLFLVASGRENLSPESVFTSAFKLDRVHKVTRQLYMLAQVIATVMAEWRLETAQAYRLHQPLN